ncbi:MAG TPA: hypothetical protein DCL49_10420, partial [Candidatus Omnitrophica bacterium]|nr:hypothetical protein [Candidatus Omnitrophota bacterium]
KIVASAASFATLSGMGGMGGMYGDLGTWSRVGVGAAAGAASAGVSEVISPYKVGKQQSALSSLAGIATGIGVSVGLTAGLGGYSATDANAEARALSKYNDDIQKGKVGDTSYSQWKIDNHVHTSYAPSQWASAVWYKGIMDNKFSLVENVARVGIEETFGKDSAFNKMIGNTGGASIGNSLDNEGGFSMAGIGQALLHGAARGGISWGVSKLEKSMGGFTNNPFGEAFLVNTFSAATWGIIHGIKSGKESVAGSALGMVQESWQKNGMEAITFGWSSRQDTVWGNFNYMNNLQNTMFNMANTSFAEGFVQYATDVYHYGSVDNFMGAAQYFRPTALLSGQNHKKWNPNGGANMFEDGRWSKILSSYKKDNPTYYSGMIVENGIVKVNVSEWKGGFWLGYKGHTALQGTSMGTDAEFELIEASSEHMKQVAEDMGYKIKGGGTQLSFKQIPSQFNTAGPGLYRPDADLNKINNLNEQLTVEKYNESGSTEGYKKWKEKEYEELMPEYQAAGAVEIFGGPVIGPVKMGEVGPAEELIIKRDGQMAKFTTLLGTHLKNSLSPSQGNMSGEDFQRAQKEIIFRVKGTDANSLLQGMEISPGVVVTKAHAEQLKNEENEQIASLRIVPGTEVEMDGKTYVISAVAINRRTDVLVFTLGNSDSFANIPLGKKVPTYHISAKKPSGKTDAKGNQPYSEDLFFYEPDGTLQSGIKVPEHHNKEIIVRLDSEGNLMIAPATSITDPDGSVEIQPGYKGDIPIGRTTQPGYSGTPVAYKDKNGIVHGVGDVSGANILGDRWDKKRDLSEQSYDDKYDQNSANNYNPYTIVTNAWKIRTVIRELANSMGSTAKTTVSGSTVVRQDKELTAQYTMSKPGISLKDGTKGERDFVTFVNTSDDNVLLRAIKAGALPQDTKGGWQIYNSAKHVGYAYDPKSGRQDLMQLGAKDSLLNRRWVGMLGGQSVSGANGEMIESQKKPLTLVYGQYGNTFINQALLTINAIYYSKNVGDVPWGDKAAVMQTKDTTSKNEPYSAHIFGVELDNSKVRGFQQEFAKGGKDFADSQIFYRSLYGGEAFMASGWAKDVSINGRTHRVSGLASGKLSQIKNIRVDDMIEVYSVTNNSKSSPKSACQDGPCPASPNSQTDRDKEYSVFAKEDRLVFGEGTFSIRQDSLSGDWTPAFSNGDRVKLYNEIEMPSSVDKDGIVQESIFDPKDLNKIQGYDAKTQSIGITDPIKLEHTHQLLFTPERIVSGGAIVETGLGYSYKKAGLTAELKDKNLMRVSEVIEGEDLKNSKAANRPGYDEETHILFEPVFHYGWEDTQQGIQQRFGGFTEGQDDRINVFGGDNQPLVPRVKSESSIKKYDGSGKVFWEASANEIQKGLKIEKRIVTPEGITSKKLNGFIGQLQLLRDIDKDIDSSNQKEIIRKLSELAKMEGFDTSNWHKEAALDLLQRISPNLMVNEKAIDASEFGRYSIVTDLIQNTFADIHATVLEIDANKGWAGPAKPPSSDSPGQSKPIFMTRTRGDVASTPFSNINNYTGKIEASFGEGRQLQYHYFSPGAQWRLPKGQNEVTFMTDRWTWLPVVGKQGVISIGLNSRPYGGVGDTVSRFSDRDYEWKNNSNLKILLHQAQGILRGLEKMGLDSLRIAEKIKKASPGQELKFEVNEVTSVFSGEEVALLQESLSHLEQIENGIKDKKDVLSKLPEEKEKIQKDYIQKSAEFYDKVMSKLNSGEKVSVQEYLQEVGREVLIKAVSNGKQAVDIELLNSDREPITISTEIIGKSASAVDMAKAIVLEQNPDLKDTDGVDVTTVLEATLKGDALWGILGPDRRYDGYGQPLGFKDPNLSVTVGNPQKPMLKWETKEGLTFFEGDRISVSAKSLVAPSFSLGGAGGTAKRLDLTLSLDPVKGGEGLFTEYKAKEGSIPLDITHIEPTLSTLGQSGSLNPNNVFMAKRYEGNDGYFTDPKTRLIMKWNKESSITFIPAKDGKYDVVNLGTAATVFDEVSLGYSNDGAQKFSLQVAQKGITYNGSMIESQKKEPIQEKNLISQNDIADLLSKALSLDPNKKPLGIEFQDLNLSLIPSTKPADKSAEKKTITPASKNSLTDFNLVNGTASTEPLSQEQKAKIEKIEAERKELSLADSGIMKEAEKTTINLVQVWSQGQEKIGNPGQLQAEKEVNNDAAKEEQKAINLWRPQDSDLAAKVFESGLFVDIGGGGFDKTHIVPFKGLNYDDKLRGLVVMWGGGADQNIKVGVNNIHRGSGTEANSVEEKENVDIKTLNSYVLARGIVGGDSGVTDVNVSGKGKLGGRFIGYVHNIGSSDLGVTLGLPGSGFEFYAREQDITQEVKDLMEKAGINPEQLKAATIEQDKDSKEFYVHYKKGEKLGIKEFVQKEGGKYQQFTASLDVLYKDIEDNGLTFKGKNVSRTYFGAGKDPGGLFVLEDGIRVDSQGTR